MLRKRGESNLSLFLFLYVFSSKPRMAFRHQSFSDRTEGIRGRLGKNSAGDSLCSEFLRTSALPCVRHHRFGSSQKNSGGGVGTATNHRLFLLVRLLQPY